MARHHHPDHLRRRIALLAAGTATLALTVALPAAAAVGPDHPVTTDSPYVKANGRVAPPGDAITTCGTNRRQQNEPTSAVNPANSAIVTSGSNDYCTVELAGGTWAGFYRSTTSGATWTDSLLPGYPTDTSPEGLASPLHQKGITNAGDPVQAWDRDGRLFYMGNAFNRAAPQNGSVWVATYDQDAAHYVRTVIVGKGAPALNGKFNDKTSIEVDRGLDSPYAGNVYTAWSVFQGVNGNNEIRLSRSTDHGVTFSNPMKISEGSLGNQFPDIAVTRNGTVYIAWNGHVGSRANGYDAMLWVRSTDGGRSFTKPAVAANFDGFDAADTVGDPEAAAEAHEQAFENADGPESEAETTAAGNARDCGSGPFACESGFVFFRHDSQPRITADPADATNTVSMVFDATDPNTEVPSTSTYNTAPVAPDGTLMVGQGAIYLTQKVGNAAWTAPRKLAPTPVGHQFFPDINADAGYLFALWHDSRNDPATACRTLRATPPRRMRRASTCPRWASTPTVPPRSTAGRHGRSSGSRRGRRCRTTRCSATGACRSTATTTTCRASATSRSARGPTPGRSGRVTTRGTWAARASTSTSAVPSSPTGRTGRTPARTPADSTRTSTA